jgi:D-glycero-D-manno-heptose 1,7-bisphosphate phosphatase
MRSSIGFLVRTMAGSQRNIKLKSMVFFTSVLELQSFPVFPHNPRMNRGVFIDRDGTIIEEKEYLCDPEKVVVFPGAAPALRRLREAGFKLIVVSNQAGVGRGYFTMREVDAVNARVLAELSREPVAFDRIYIAPEAPGQPSRGRKPSPQFLFDARDEFDLDLAQCYMIGDKLIDLESGWNAGVKKSILVRTGYGKEWEHKAADQIKKGLVVDDLPAAAEWICREERQV